MEIFVRNGLIETSSSKFQFFPLYLKIRGGKVSSRSSHFDTTQISVSYSEPCQTSKMECLEVIVNSF